MRKNIQEEDSEMNLGTRKVLISIACGTLMVGGIFLVRCGNTNPADSGSRVSPTPLTDLVVSDQITGWVVDSNYSDTAMPFTDATSNDRVDGGNIDYCGSCNGHDALKSGIATYFKNTQNNHKVEVFILDYGTAGAAKAEFNVWVGKKAGLTTETIAPYSTSTAIGFDVGGGLYAYANLVNFYVEMQFANYDSSSQVIPDASAFLSYYSSKIK
jgi:hypothetical protein